MTIFQYKDYRSFLRDWISKQERGGRGQVAKLAEALGIHPTLMSLILSGERELTNEHAYLLAKHLELTEPEIEFLELLTQHSRASHHAYKKHVLEKIEKKRSHALHPSGRFKPQERLPSEISAVFYSHWHYSALSLYCSTHKDGRSLEEVVEHFQCKRSRALEVLGFLETAQIVKRNRQKYILGQQTTYVDPSSPFLAQHHASWRLRGLERVTTLGEEEMMYTGPMSISREDFQKLRNLLSETVRKSVDLVQPSPPEELACLTIDLLWMQP